MVINLHVFLTHKSDTLIFVAILFDKQFKKLLTLTKILTIIIMDNPSAPAWMQEVLQKKQRKSKGKIAQKSRFQLLFICVSIACYL